MLEIRHYVTRARKDVFDDWLSQLADARAQAQIVTRVNRLSRGNFGDCKTAAAGSLRAADRLGALLPGLLRNAGRLCVLLLCGGDKRKQSSDIDRALEHLKERTRTP